MAMIICPAGMTHAQEGVVINEVMQSNIDYIMVENDFPDSWVELYNPTSSDIDLCGYYFGEKTDPAKDYQLPVGTVVPAMGHLVIYCDKEGEGLHTNFRVDAGNASLYLLDPQGNVVDHLDMAEMPAANIAYGRVTDGAEEWQYELTPTIGLPNAGGGSSALLPDPVFSVKGGVVKGSNVMVTISTPEGVELPDDAKLYVTVDGSEPTKKSRFVSNNYTFNLTKTTVIRAKFISDKALSPRSVTQSYIFHPRELSMPVISLVSDQGYFYDANNGILVANVNDGKPNYMQKWRRPVNVEYFDVEGESVVFNQLGETAVSGVSTREFPQKSMKIYTNKRFGKKNFKGKFWEDKPGVKKIKSFVIRSGGNNSFLARINDAAVQKLFGTHVDNMDWQAYQPVVVYLNGWYLGEFGMRERSDENYVEANYDGLEDVEVADEASYQSPVAGTLFESFRNDYRRADVTYAELDAQMDMDNFVKTLIAEIYGQNTDYPTNNVSMWRPLADGGKWRWILKDMDRFGVNLILYPPTFDMFNYMFNPDPLQYSGLYHFDLYKKMVSFPEFRENLIDKLSVYLGDFLRADVVTELIDRMDAEVYDEVKATFSNYNVKFNNFTSGTNYLKATVADRPSVLYGQMASYFGLGKVLGMKIVANGQDVRVNDVPLTEGDFDGAYFADRKLRLSSGADDCGWTMSVAHKDGTVEEKVFEDSNVTVLLSEYMKGVNDAIEVTFTAAKVDDGISAPMMLTGDAEGEVYGVNGVKENRDLLQKGKVYIVGGKKLIK